jgi:hypothetical protein
MTEIARAILCGGTLAGSLDAMAATTYFRSQGIRPGRVWQNVASGMLGRKSFDLGGKTVALGLLAHFGIAFASATVFCFAASYVPVVLRFPVTAGVLYGVVVYLVMNRIVLPLSAMPKRQLPKGAIAIQLAFHIFLIGLPITLSASFLALR